VYRERDICVYRERDVGNRAEGLNGCQYIHIIHIYLSLRCSIGNPQGSEFKTAGPRAERGGGGGGGEGGTSGGSSRLIRLPSAAAARVRLRVVVFKAGGRERASYLPSR
jgi:hypothetical protein